jgi:hypothetical protein
LQNAGWESEVVEVANDVEQEFGGAGGKREFREEQDEDRLDEQLECDEQDDEEEDEDVDEEDERDEDDEERDEDDDDEDSSLEDPEDEQDDDDEHAEEQRVDSKWSVRVRSTLTGEDEEEAAANDLRNSSAARLWREKTLERAFGGSMTEDSTFGANLLFKEITDFSATKNGKQFDVSANHWQNNHLEQTQRRYLHKQQTKNRLIKKTRNNFNKWKKTKISGSNRFKYKFDLVAREHCSSLFLVDKDHEIKLKQKRNE